MPTINDYKKKALNDAGYSGDISTAEWKWLKDICYPYVGAIPDMWRYALRQMGFSGSLIEAQSAMLKGLGYTDFSMNNKWYKYWRDTPLEGTTWWPVGSALAFEFDNSRGFNSIDRTKTTPDSILTYTSPSPKMVYGDDGVLRYAPHNLLTYSEKIDNAAWTKAAGTASSASTIEDTGAGADVYNIINLSGTGFQAQCEVKAHDSTLWVWFRIRTNGVYAGFFFNPNTGVIGTTTGAATEISAVALADGWYRLSFVAASGVGAVTDLFRVQTATTDNDPATASGDGGIAIRNSQLQKYPNHSNTYIPTTTAAVYSLPIDHNPTTFDPLGVLIEEQRTNLLTYSEQFDNAVWAPSGSSVTANQTTAPNGTNTADLLVSNTASSQHLIAQASGPVVTTGTTYTGSIFLKKGIGATAPNWVQLTMSGATFGAVQYANFNLNTGAVGTVGAGATAAIQDVGNGWYRCSIAAAATATANGSLVVLFTNNNDALGRAPSYVDAGTSDVYVWGAQLEAGAFPTSYIPTVASQVTRLADQVSILTSAFGYVNDGYTLYSEMTGTEPGFYSYQIGFQQNSGITDGAWFTTNTPGVNGRVRSGNGDSANFNPVPTINPASGFVKQVLVVATNDFAYTKNGNTVAVDGTGAVPTGITKFSLMFYLNGKFHIKRLTYFPTRRTNADLQVLTT